MKAESYHSMWLRREITKALAEPVTWSGFPKDDVQADHHPFAGELIPLPSVLPSRELSLSSFVSTSVFNSFCCF